MKSYYNLIPFLFLFFCGCMPLSAQLHMTINGSQVSHTVSPLIQGHGLVYSEEDDFIYKDGTMAQLYKDVGAGFLRWPGGTVATMYHWNNLTGVGWVDNWNPHWNNNSNRNSSKFMDLDEYITLTRAAGTTPMLGINMSSGMEWNREAEAIQEAVDMILYCKAQGFDVKHFFLDNETYHSGNGHNKDPNGDGKAWTVTTYAQKINVYAAAIKQHVPDAVLIANWSDKFRSRVSQYQTLLDIAGDNIDYIDVHWYWKWGTSSWSEWKAKTPMENETSYYNGGTFIEETQFFNNLAASRGKSHVKLAVLEWNIAPGDHNTNPAHTPFKTALMGSEMQMQMMQADIELASMWTTQWKGSSTADFQFLINSDDNYNPSPMAKVFELYKNALNGNVVGSSINDNQVMTTTVVKGAKVYAYILSKDNVNNNVEFNFTGLNVASVGEAKRFSDPGTVTDISLWNNASSGNFMAYVPANTLTMVAFNRDTGGGGGLVLNGDFENGLNNWDTWNNPLVTTDSHQGSNAAKMVDEGSINQAVVVEPNTTYTLSAYMKTSDTSKSVVLGVNDINGNGMAAVDAFSAQYSLHQMTFTTRAGQSSVIVYGWQPASGGASAFIDNITLVKATGTDTTAPSPNTATFAMVPAADSDTAISMTATIGNPINVSVNTSNTIAGWVDKKYGINLNSGVDHDSNRAAGATSLTSAISTIGAKRLRYPGGEKSNAFAWTADPANPNPATQYWIGFYRTSAGTTMNFDEFMAVCNASGAEAHINVCAPNNWNSALGTTTEMVASAAAWVRYANVTKGYGVEYWEIGNEMWHPDNKPNWTASQLAAIVIQYSNAMKSVDPSIKIGISCKSGDAQTIINLCGNALDFIAISNYTNYGGSYDAYMNTSNVNLLKVNTGLTKPSVISEFNGALWAPEGTDKYWWDVGNHTGIGIINFDLVGQILKSSKTLYGCMWNTRWYPDENGVYGGTKWDAFDNQNNLRAVIQPFALWGQFIERDLVQISAGDSAIVAYAAYNNVNKDLNVFLVNKSTWQSKNISLNITGSTYRRCEVTQFKGDHEWDDHPTINQLANATVSGNQVSYTLPNTSITVLALRTTAVPPTPGELINGDFENGLNNWDTWNNPLVTTDSHQGSNAAKMVDEGSINQAVVVEPNTTYTLSAYMKTSDTSKSVVLGVNDINGNGMAAVDAFSAQYSLHQMTFTTRAGQSSVIVYGWQPASGGASAFIDNITLVKATGTDTTAPSPNTATFAMVPAADSDTAISMTATIGSDPSGPVQYKFTETSGNPGATSSGWQTSSSYTDSGLNPSTQYTYTVQMRDSLGNTGTASLAASATTTGGTGGGSPYGTWASDNSVTGDFGDDDDGDGIANGYEWYFLDSDPKSATASHGSQLTNLTATAPGIYAFSHVRPMNRTDVTETYQWSRDQITWYAGGESNGAGLTVNFTDTGTSGARLGTEHETVTMSATIAGPLPPQLFFRLSLSGTSDDPS